MIIITALKRLFFLFVLTALVACSKPPYTDTNGNAIDLTSDKGQWLVVNFWAEWCDPCRDEIPELNELASVGAVRVIGMDFDGSQGSELKQKVAALGIEFPVIQQSPLAALEVKVPQVLPTTLIVNPEGKVAEILYGPQTKASLEKQVRKFQEQKADG